MSYQLQEGYSGIMVSLLACIRAPYHVISDNIHNLLLPTALQVQQINTACHS